MKKTLTILLAIALLLTLAACGLTGGSSRSKDSHLTDEILSGLNDAADAAEAASPADAPAAAPNDAPAPDSAESVPADFDPAFRFETTTLRGESVDESVLAGHTLTMINFFEPWCPPCIAELPDLEKLYETYAPQGFQILGVYSTEDGIEKVVSDAGLSYPVLRYVDVFDQFQTGYVPTTIFVDGRGQIVGETQIGSNSYAGWEAVIRDLMK